MTGKDLKKLLNELIEDNGLYETNEININEIIAKMQIKK